MKPLYIILLFCRRRLFELLLFLVIMLILTLFLKHLYIMKFRDVLYHLNCVFMFKFYHNLLPSAFHYFSYPYNVYQVGRSKILDLDCLLNQCFVFLNCQD